MNKNRTIVITFSAFVLAIIFGIIANWLIPTTDKGEVISHAFEDAATALAFIGAAAIGIERFMEGGWNIMSHMKDTFWPLNKVSEQMESLIDNLDTALTCFKEQAVNEVHALKSNAKDLKEKLEKAEDDLKTFKDQFDEIKKYTKNTQRVQLLTSVASQQISSFNNTYGDILAGINTTEPVAKNAVSAVENFLSSFNDNPGKRLISVFAGSIIGMLVAGYFGLDVFEATLGDPSGHPRVAILLTGLIIGLGANPTHDVIRALQEFKKAQKSESNVTS